MRPFTVKTKIVAEDKASKNINKVNKAAMRMSKTVTTESRIAGSSFSRFVKRVGIGTKKASVSLGLFNARVNQVSHNVRKRVGKMLGTLGRLGVGIGLAAILMTVARANIELDASLASLQAITGVTGAKFDSFRKNIDELSKSEKLFAGDTAKAFEIVGSAQPILLKSADNLGLVTKAAITLKKAGLIPIEDSAKAVTGTMNQFELGASEAERVINVLAAGAKEGSANIQLLSESMDRVGAVAKAANMSVEQTGAAVELMSKYNLKGSEAGISLKSTILRLKSASLGFASGQFNLNDALKEYNAQMTLIKDPIKKAAKEEEVFGKIHILTGKILTENIGELDRLTDAMTGTNEATLQAGINNNTLKNRLEEIKNAFKNSITATGEQTDQMNFLKNIMVKVADNMDKIIKAVVIAIGVFAAFKAVTLALVIAQKAMYAAMVLGKFIQFVGIVMNIAKAQGIWTAAQWALNFAMSANPIGLIIIGIAALITGIVLLVKNFDKVKNAISGFYDRIKSNPILKFLFLPIIMIVEAIKLLVKNWDKIKAAIIRVWNPIKKFFSFVIGGFKKFGSIIKTAIVDRFKAISSFVSKIIEKVQMFFGGKNKIETKSEEISTKTTKEIKLNKDLKNKTLEKVDIQTKGTDKMVAALDKNTKVVEENSNTGKEWKGKFYTSMLKDANISDRTVTRELAISTVRNENNIISEQRNVIGQREQTESPVSSSRFSRNPNDKKELIITVNNNTGNKYSIQVEGTGIDVVRTGNA